MTKKVLIVYHLLTENTEIAARAVAEGVRSVEGVEPLLKRASEADADDLTSCDAICFGTRDYFNYMDGILKDFFDRTFYPTQEQVNDKMYGMFVTHEGRGSEASESIKEMCRSFKFKQITEVLLVRGSPDDEAVADLRQLGIILARAVL